MSLKTLEVRALIRRLEQDEHTLTVSLPGARDRYQATFEEWAAIGDRLGVLETEGHAQLVAHHGIDYSMQWRPPAWAERERLQPRRVQLGMVVDELHRIIRAGERDLASIPDKVAAAREELAVLEAPTVPVVTVEQASLAARLRAKLTGATA